MINLSNIINLIGKKITLGWFEVFFVIGVLLITTIIPRIIGIINIPWNFLFTLFKCSGLKGAEEGSRILPLLSFIVWPLLVTYFLGFFCRICCYFIRNGKYLTVSYFYLLFIIISFIICVDSKYWSEKMHYIFMTF